MKTLLLLFFLLAVGLLADIGLRDADSTSIHSPTVQSRPTTPMAGAPSKANLVVPFLGGMVVLLFLGSRWYGRHGKSPKKAHWSAPSSSHHLALLLISAVVGADALIPSASAQTTMLQIDNPNWNITLTDFGYSDFLFDNTPGFEGREYLSGEWGAAIGYGSTSPQWLDPNFLYPDWTTNSTFHVVNPISLVGTNAATLPIAESVIANNDLQITLRYEMLDTIVGTPMGTKAASATGAGTFVDSNRYVLQQTYTVENISGGTIDNVQLFQLLHGLNAQSGVYDNRAYAGALSNYQYDTTLHGTDPNSAGAGSSSAGLEDYIGFQAAVAPTAFEIGRYGTEGIDDHGLGKPSDGVHLSIEANWQGAPYASRQGTDSFAPVDRWIAGGQRWNLGTLASGNSTSFSLLLSILTGTKVTADPGTGGGSGSGNGGTTHVGGVDFSFDDIGQEGSFFSEYSSADFDEIQFRIDDGDFSELTFGIAGASAQLWELEFDGEYSGLIHLIFAYDPSLLTPGFDESQLAVYHYNGTAWEQLPGVVDPLNHTIAVDTSSLSPFVLGTVTAAPEPSSALLAVLGGAGLLCRWRRRSATI